MGLSLRASYLGLGPEHEQQLHALIAGQFGTITGHSGQLLPTRQRLVFTEQVHHQVIIQTTDRTLIEGPIEQGHGEPHYRSHTSSTENAHQHPEVAQAVPMGAQLHGVEAAASVEPPQPAGEQETQNQEHCSRAQQEGQPVGKVLVVVARALKGNHGENSLPTYSHESHEAVANGGFLVHEETQDCLEVIHGIGGEVSDTLHEKLTKVKDRM